MATTVKLFGDRVIAAAHQTGRPNQWVLTAVHGVSRRHPAGKVEAIIEIANGGSGVSFTANGLDFALFWNLPCRQESRSD